MPAYPGTPIQLNEPNAALVGQLQTALARKGYTCPTAGRFDAGMASAVKLFQAQNVDSAGNPLKVDGVVGSFTWTALFGLVWTAAQPSSAIASMALSVATTQIGVMETPGKPNRGPMVDQYLKAVGLNAAGGGAAGYAWCQAFVYWCFANASAKLGVANPCSKTAGVLDHWNKAGRNPKAVRHTAKDVIADLSLASHGAVVAYDFGGGAGHIAFVEQCRADGSIDTVEGNTNPVGGREGLGVFRLSRRKISAADKNLKGLIVYLD
jgi:hypothetical protein